MPVCPDKAVLAGQPRQISHLIHSSVQALQQTQRVQALHHRGFGVDHDVFKKRIYGRTQSRQRL